MDSTLSVEMDVVSPFVYIFLVRNNLESRKGEIFVCTELSEEDQL